MVWGGEGEEKREMEMERERDYEICYLLLLYFLIILTLCQEDVDFLMEQLNIETILLCHEWLTTSVVLSMPHLNSLPHGILALENTICSLTVVDEGEDIPEEEAVCRICFVALREGADAFKLECSCKGELALAHRECAIKWFSIKGNKNCDVCKQEVQNLPVTLLRLQNPQTTNGMTTIFPERSFKLLSKYTSLLTGYGRIFQLVKWVPVLLPYLYLVLVFWVSSHPLFASTMVNKGYIWVYASFQFAIVIVFAHVFYNVFNVAAVLSVILSSFTGFGIAFSANSLLVEVLKWRTRRNRRLELQQNNGEQQQTTANSETQHGGT
ncbi:hypothetical protein HPP92_002161 [Vanilla planifolia]|uniref:RING-CH-type domain-containing protein n=1 Tax=Vanilla planifolia TaxID=51239 RepID=A0A835VHR5_VANPL|nr:hypothetical protein HPP92_002161 [Vanilla planifolia]